MSKQDKTHAADLNQLKSIDDAADDLDEIPFYIRETVQRIIDRRVK